MKRSINIGLMGHVDSGKTSLSKALSTMGSTAAFDKNPQSKRRGITIDLGFSSFEIQQDSKDALQVCLVDCPGHASLIKTIVGGSQIIDAIILVIDAKKGIEAQTAESIVVSDIIGKPVIVVLNKMDTLRKEDLKGKKFLGLQKILRKNVSKRIVELSAKNLEDNPKEELEKMILDIYNNKPKKEEERDALFVFDHCFKVSGKGTIFTGTILKGLLNVNDKLFISANMNEGLSIKSMQMFKKPITSGKRGDRVALLFSKLNVTKKLERGYATSNPETLHFSKKILIKVNVARFFKRDLKSHAKYHFIFGHNTTMGFPIFFDENKIYSPTIKLKKKKQKENEEKKKEYFALIELERETIFYEKMICIGAKLDMNIKSTPCRLGFFGEIQSVPEDLKIFKEKSKKCFVDRVVSDYEIIGRGIVYVPKKKEGQKKKKVDLSFYIGKKIRWNGVVGKIESSFGASGKFKVRFQDPISGCKKGDQLFFTYKVNIFEKKRNMYQ